MLSVNDFQQSFDDSELHDLMTASYTHNDSFDNDEVDNGILQSSRYFSCSVARVDFILAHYTSPYLTLFGEQNDHSVFNTFYVPDGVTINTGKLSFHAE